MTTNVLYVGNYLKGPNRNPSYMFTLGRILKDLGFSVHFTSGKLNPLFRLMDMKLTLWTLRKQIDVVVIDTYSTNNYYYAVIIGRLCRWFRIPYVPILHGGGLSERLEKSSKLSQSLFGKAFVNVAPSGYLLKVFQEKGFRNVQLIPNAIPLAQYSCKVRNEARLRLLWVRRLQELYNPLMALKVMKLLKNKGYDAELCVVGPDTEGLQEELMKFVKENHLNVQFTGALSKEEWHQLSESYDLFLNTTTIDNTPVSVIEAMALGLGVISTNVGGIPYLIEDGVDGLLVPVNDHESMAEAVVNMVEEIPAFASMTRKGREKVELFDTEVVKHQWEKLFQEVTST